MILLDLNPEWCGLTKKPEHGEGISFDCPTCGPKHRLIAFFSNPLDGEPLVEWQKPRWERIGERFESITIKPSIQYSCFHGWVENGRVFLASQAPLHVIGTVNGQAKVIQLSPMQCLEMLPAVMERAKQMLDGLITE